MFINRDYTRLVEDNFKLNVEDRLQAGKEAVPVFDAVYGLVGWRVQDQYE